LPTERSNRRRTTVSGTSCPPFSTRSLDSRQRHIDTLDEEEEQVNYVTLPLEPLDQAQVASTRECRLETKDPGGTAAMSPIVAVG